MKIFLEKAKEIATEVTEWRRTLHMHPEVSFAEKWTTAFIKDKLEEFGIEIAPWGGETGIVGILKGGKGAGRCVALRADIDALPLQEKTGASYASKIDGAMHACGHDAHTAGLLAAAKLLSACRDQFAGTVKFIFQPAEELLTGAEKLVAANVLENVDFIFGMHNTPDAPTGTMLLKSGPVMAASASTFITVHGKGGHGALPQHAKDPVLAACAIVQSLQSIVSRQVPPNDPAVVTIGSIHGGTVGNIIPDSVDMKGTVRLFNMEIFNDMERRMRHIIDATADAYGTTADFTYQVVVPTVNNPEDLTEWVRSGPLEKVFGADHIKEHEKMTGSEDFSRYQEKIPGIFCFYGVANEEKGTTASWHNPKFDIDEDALPYAAASFVEVAFAALGDSYPRK